MPDGLSLDQMMRVPYVMDVISRIWSPGADIQRFYGLSPMGPAAQTIKGRAGQYDIFDYTRSLLPMGAPVGVPTRIARKQIGTQPITLPRIYASVDILYESIYNTRELGQQYRPVGSMGQAYIAKQMQYIKTRHDNNFEFMASRMFSGGWGYKSLAGSSHQVLCEATDAATDKIVNDLRVPADHKGQLGGIIDATWANSSTDIVDQLFSLQVKAARVSGRRIRHIWLNGNTGKHLFTNSVIQGVGGSVYRIFDTFNPTKEFTPEQKMPDTGVSVIFRGLPDYTFHIYNQGFVTPGTGESYEDQIASANWNYFIPDNVAIMTPEPGEWCGVIKGSEMAQFSLTDPVQEVVGFGMGIERAIDPPRFDIKLLNNAAPVLIEPRSCYYATVIF